MCLCIIINHYFAETELKVLKEEFSHHQEKVLQFYSLMEEHNSQKLRDNSKQCDSLTVF